MPKETLAEIVLTIACGRARASEILGDMLELYGLSSYKIYTAVLSVVLPAAWRFVFSFVILASSTIALLTEYVKHKYLAVQQVGSAVPHGVLWSLAALCFWSVLVQNLSKFGFKDRLNPVAAIMVALLMTCAVAEGSRYEDFAIAGTVLCVLALLSNALLRRSLGCVTLSAAVYAGVFMLGVSPVGYSLRSVTVVILELVLAWLLSFQAERWVLTNSRFRFDLH